MLIFEKKQYFRRKSSKVPSRNFVEHFEFYLDPKVHEERICSSYNYIISKEDF